MKQLLIYFKRLIAKWRFRSAEHYWENRYARGGNSGPGSRGAELRHKLAFVQKFITDNRVKSVFDYGSGDGEFASKLVVPTYYGYEPSPSARQMFFDRDLPRSYMTGTWLYLAELGLSLDVIFHVVDADDYVEYLENLFRTSLKWIIIYGFESSEEELWPHIKPRPFTRFIANRFPEWVLISKIPSGFGEKTFYVYQYESQTAA